MLPAPGGQPAQIDLGTAVVSTDAPTAQALTGSPTPSTQATTAEVLAASEAPANLAPEDVDCADFPTWEAANAWFETNYPSFGDVANLDEDDDLIPCEALIGAPGSGDPSTTVIAVVAAPAPTFTTGPRTPEAQVPPGQLATTGVNKVTQLVITGAGALILGVITLLLARPQRRTNHRHWS